jgi:hypothetical protein
MRYMINVKATPQTEADVMPSPEIIEAMGKFNDELIKAGVMLAAEGLRSTRFGSLVQYQGGRHTVTDGPFAESKEVIAGFWIIDVKDKAEAIAWAEKIPFEEGEVEIRRVSEVDDFKYDEVSAETLDMERAFQAEHVKPIKG